MSGRIGWGAVIALAVQTAAALVWTGQAAARLQAVERRLESQTSVGERLARLEAQLVDARAAIARIEAHIDDER